MHIYINISYVHYKYKYLEDVFNALCISSNYRRMNYYIFRTVSTIVSQRELINILSGF